MTVRNQVAGGNRQQEEAVQIGVNGWRGQRDAEKLSEKRPSRQHHDADEPVVDAADGRDQLQSAI